MTTTAALVEDLKRQLAAGSRAGANQAVAALLAARPKLGGQWLALARLALHNGELTLALQAVDRLVADQDGAPDAQFHRASILAQSGRLDDAWAVMASLPETIPDPLGGAYLRGTMSVNRGDLPTARHWLSKAVDLDPNSGQSWLALAMAGEMTDAQQQACRQAEAGLTGASSLEHANYWYARGKLAHDAGDHDGAMQAFAKGAALMQREQRYNPAADLANARAAISGYDAQTLSRLSQQVEDAGEDGRRAILVTGLPRSGTTLVEQILTSHSHVTGGEELSRFRLVSQDLGGVEAHRLRDWQASGKSLADLTKLYLHLITERFGSTGRVVDKTLDASRYLGLAAALLPRAPIIWLRRDPRDCAWSAYRTYFARGLSWSWDLENIAAHMKIEDALCAHWQDILGPRLLVLDYAELVTSPKAQIDRLLDHCGLAVEPGVYAPHMAARNVVTASVLQVREPINRKGLGVSAAYQAALAPFAAAYQKPASLL